MLLGLALEAAPPGRRNVSVLMGEAAFLASPYAQGETVRLAWAEADARALAAPPQAPPPHPIPAPSPATFHTEALSP